MANADQLVLQEALLRALSLSSDVLSAFVSELEAILDLPSSLALKGSIGTQESARPCHGVRLALQQVPTAPSLSQPQRRDLLSDQTYQLAAMHSNTASNRVSNSLLHSLTLPSYWRAAPEN